MVGGLTDAFASTQNGVGRGMHPAEPGQVGVNVVPRPWARVNRHHYRSKNDSDIKFKHLYFMACAILLKETQIHEIAYTRNIIFESLRSNNVF